MELSDRPQELLARYVDDSLNFKSRSSTHSRYPAMSASASVFVAADALNNLVKSIGTEVSLLFARSTKCDNQPYYNAAINRDSRICIVNDVFCSVPAIKENIYVILTSLEYLKNSGRQRCCATLYHNNERHLTFKVVGSECGKEKTDSINSCIINFEKHEKYTCKTNTNYNHVRNNHNEMEGVRFIY